MPGKDYETLINDTSISTQLNFWIRKEYEWSVDDGFLNLAQNRYSVRKFMSKQVEEEKVDLILEAGRVAPTAVLFKLDIVIEEWTKVKRKR